eukprot:CAMPEP_0195524942 /NCGR_PEP_ID=MMETSP0794_2-20130614/25075_1 /TAXON_ID=515487 /ORGANISM="Stephanopyxis turris, Strain CCMP 815" /LENGTH=354 /DNA_ID=CAMNT_0040655277 /DNA_START=182 /DNA_END=1246 /DNA_ORIENTATION=+
MSTNTSSMSSSGAKKSPWPELRLPSKNIIDKRPMEGSTNSVLSCMNYIARDVTLVRARRDLGGTDGSLEGAKWDTQDVEILNARRKTERGERMTLDRNGFELVPDPISDQGIDFFDQESVLNEYYPRCERLVKRTTGGTTVLAFDHNVRSSGTRSGEQMRNGSVVQQPAGLAHNDYTRVSAPRRLEQLTLPPKANDVLKSRLGNEPPLCRDVLQRKKRYAFVNVWRNVREEPVACAPLACVDAKSNTMDDLVTFRIVYSDRVGENYFVKHSQKHDWKYFDGMELEEALLIKQWDSDGGIARGRDEDFDGSEEEEDGRSTFSIHSAFLDPSSPPDAPPRESIEVRCVVVWEEEDY